MTTHRISRRAVAPALVAGIAAAPIAAAAPVSPFARSRKKARQSSCLSNIRAFRGETLVLQLFLPEGPVAVNTSTEFELTLKSLDGTTLARQTFQLLPGRGTEMKLDVRGDGMVLFNGEVVAGDFDGDGNGDAIIAILVGLLPAVQAIVGTVTAFIPGDGRGPLREVRNAGIFVRGAQPIVLDSTE